MFLNPIRFPSRLYMSFYIASALRHTRMMPLHMYEIAKYWAACWEKIAVIHRMDRRDVFFCNVWKFWRQAMYSHVL